MNWFELNWIVSATENLEKSSTWWFNLDKVGNEGIIFVFHVLLNFPQQSLVKLFCHQTYMIVQQNFIKYVCHQDLPQKQLRCCITAVIVVLQAPTEIVRFNQHGVFKCFKINLEYHSFSELGWQCSEWSNYLREVCIDKKINVWSSVSDALNVQEWIGSSIEKLC